MGIGKFFRKVGSAVAHPKQTAERMARKRMIAMAVATLLGLAAAAGYQTSPAFQDAITTAVDAIIIAIEEAPVPEPAEVPGDPAEEAPVEEAADEQ